MNRGERAAELFTQGYNCAQALMVTFCDMIGMDEKAAARSVSAFGGGMGRLREVCGAVSGMFAVVSILYGYDEAGDDTAKKELYQLVQNLGGQFREKCGSIICREILKNPPSDPVPSTRTEEYYATRPCVRMVYTAAEILSDYIASHPVNL